MATESNSNTFNSEFRKVIDPLGANLDQVDSSAKHTLGTHARDSRGGVYVYLKGVASNVQFAWVNYFIGGDITAAVALATTTTVDTRDPIAVSCAAITADEYGWFQIQGPAYARYLVSMATGSTVQSTTTAGCMDDTDTTTVVGVVCAETEGGSGTDNLKTFLVFPPQAGIAL